MFNFFLPQNVRAYFHCILLYLIVTVPFLYTHFFSFFRHYIFVDQYTYQYDKKEN